MSRPTGTILPFVKMHGAGNDFVMVDGRNLAGPLTPTTVAALCDRRTGIGADGLIVLGAARSPAADFVMTYFNADGYPAEMCGNGARCSVAFAHAIGLTERNCRFDTDAGTLDGGLLDDGTVDVALPPWRDLELDVQLTESPWPTVHRCNTGVPHLVIPVDDVTDLPVAEWGRRLREDPLFAPAGTNVNWIAPTADGTGYRIRTYERGVEAETLACGTGASAAAVVMCQLNEATSPVTMFTRGGDRLVVSVDLQAHGLRLRGPAETSFRGEVTIHDD